MLSRVLAFIYVLPAFCLAQGLPFPATPCDSYQAGVRDINGNNGHLVVGMTREKGSQAFAYGFNSTPFVSLQGDVISINLKLLFSPTSTPEVIKLLSFDGSCGSPLGTAIAGFGPEWDNLATQQNNTITFNRVTYDSHTVTLACRGG